MSDQINVTSLKPLSEVKKVYSGHPGCMCGCQGKYYPRTNYTKSPVVPTPSELKMIKRVYNLFNRNIDKVYTWEDSKDKFVSLDTSPNRAYTIYYKD
jgi:hypothetical protein